MKKPRTKKDIENDPRVEEFFQDSDGCWVYLHPGHAFDCERTGSRADNIREMCHQFDTIWPVPVIDGENVYPGDPRYVAVDPHAKS
jgi:hypothetical protein